MTSSGTAPDPPDAVSQAEVTDDPPPGPGRNVPFTGRGRWVLGALTAICLLAVGAAWSLASPVGSSPDDGYHLASIWCSTTASAGDCEEIGRSGGNRDVLVPAAIGPDAPCFAFDATKSATCQDALDERGTAQAAANDTAYPDGFYDLMGLLVSSDVARSVLSMRMLGWTLAMACIVGAAAIAQGRIRTAYLLAVLATYIPLGIFLFASTNPSGLAIAGIGSFWACACVFMTTADRRRLGLAAALGIVAALFAVGSRADAGLYIAAAAASALCFGRGWQRPLWRRSAALVAVAFVGAATLLTGTQTSVAAGGLSATQSDRSFVTTLWFNLINLPGLWTGSLGTSGLGWLDTTMPSSVGVGMVALCGALAFWGLAAIDREALLAAAIAASSIVVAPIVVLGASRNIVGENVQSRYLLPMLPVVLGLLLMGRRGDRLRGFSTAQRVAVVVVLTAAQSFALHANMRRYITGQDALGFDLNNVEWWWSTGVQPMTVWAIGSVAFCVCAVVGLLCCWRPPLTDDSAAADAPEPSPQPPHDGELTAQPLA